MRWFGSKKRQAARIANLFRPFNDGRPFIEPFMGSGAVLMETAKFWKGKIFAADINPFLMTYWRCIQRGCRLRRMTITEHEWQEFRHRWRYGERSWELLYIGLGTNFSPSHNGLYSTSFTDNLAYQANYAERFRPALQRARLFIKDYRFFEPAAQRGGCLFYLDPPYANSSREGSYMPSFDYDGFWNVARAWSRNSLVFVSERVAPADFECVLEMKKTTPMNFRNRRNVQRYLERVFVMKSGLAANLKSSVAAGAAGAAGDGQERAR